MKTFVEAEKRIVELFEASKASTFHFEGEEHAADWGCIASSFGICQDPEQASIGSAAQGSIEQPQDVDMSLPCMLLREWNIWIDV